MRKTKGVFGNIENLSEEEMKALIFNERFVHLWHITKDKIIICRDCEYRYMCVDKRVPKLVGDEIYQYEEGNDCGYNPYLGLWNGDDGWKSAEE